MSSNANAKYSFFCKCINVTIVLNLIFKSILQCTILYSHNTIQYNSSYMLQNHLQNAYDQNDWETNNEVKLKENSTRVDLLAKVFEFMCLFIWEGETIVCVRHSIASMI